jgi:hypothetical protein
VQVEAGQDRADLVEAARQLRAMVEALPPATPRDRRVAHRLSGAAVALDAVADRPAADS